MMTKTNYPKFELAERLTDEQVAFFEKNGFLHFTNFISQDTVNEIDGMVINYYIYTPQRNVTQMVWHTDSLRVIFYGKHITPVRDVGGHLGDASCENGCLRIVPGSHIQNLQNLLCRNEPRRH